MQVSTKFTIALHLLVAVEYFEKTTKVTSDLLASSIGSNAVIIRNLMGKLKKAGLVTVRRGTGGIALTRPLDAISFADVYRAVETDRGGLFGFHEHPNPDCPVGRNIHAALDGRLLALQEKFLDDLRSCSVGDVARDIHRANGG